MRERARKKRKKRKADRDLARCDELRKLVRRPIRIEEKLRQLLCRMSSAKILRPLGVTFGETGIAWEQVSK